MCYNKYNCSDKTARKCPQRSIPREPRHLTGVVEYWVSRPTLLKGRHQSQISERRLLLEQREFQQSRTDTLPTATSRAHPEARQVSVAAIQDKITEILQIGVGGSIWFIEEDPVSLAQNNRTILAQKETSEKALWSPAVQDVMIVLVLHNSCKWLLRHLTWAILLGLSGFRWHQGSKRRVAFAHTKANSTFLA